MAGPKCQGLAQGNDLSLLISDLDVVAGCFAVPRVGPQQHVKK